MKQEKSLTQDAVLEAAERENEAMRILCETLLESEGASGRELSALLCQNLLRVCNAQYAALAVYDKQQNCLILQGQAEQKRNRIKTKISQTRFGEVPQDILEQWKSETIARCRQDASCLFNMFGRALFFSKNIEPDRCFDFCCNQQGEVVAIASVQLWPGEELRTGKVIENFLNLAGMIIQRKNALTLLEENELRYRTLFDEANDAIFIVKGYVFIDCNAKTLELYGCKRNEIIGKTPVDFSPQLQLNGQSSEKLARKKLDAAYSGYPQRFEWLHTRLDGTPFYCEVSLNRLEYLGQVFIQAFVRDITDRKYAEQKVKQSEQFLSNVFDSIQDGISVLDEDLNIVRVNEALNKWYGHMLPLEGKKCYYAYHGRSEHCENCPTIRALQSGELEMNEVPLVGSKGAKGTLELFAFPIKDDTGKITGVVEYVRDVTGRKKTEDALRESEQEKSLILNSTKDAIRYIDTELRVIWANKASCGSANASSEEVVGRYCYEIWHHREKPCENCPAITALQTGESKEGEVTMPNGLIWYQQAIPVKDKDGNVTGAVEVCRDITATKQAQQKLEKSRENLQKIIDTMPFGVVLIDKYQNIRRVNSSTLDILGYSHSDELLGRRCYNTICPGQKDQCPILDLKQRVDLSEKKAKAKDGTFVPILKRATKIKLDNEEFLLEGFIDMRELKAARNGQAKLQEQIEQMNKKLMDLVETISNDLTGIQAAAGQLKSRCSDKIEQDSKDCLEILINNTNKMNDYIDAILSEQGIDKSATNSIEL